MRPFWGAFFDSGRGKREFLKTLIFADSIALFDVFFNPRGLKITSKMLRKQHPAKTSFQERLGSHLGAILGPKIGPEGGPKTNKSLEQISCSFLATPQNRHPPRGGTPRRSPHLGFGAFFLEIAAGASAGCKNRGSRVSGATLGAGGRS